MRLSLLDLSIVLAYLAFALIVGLLSLRRASRSTEAFFAAGRSLPGWLLGVSMVATTFAVDTPLVVTGIVAGDGIVGNWFWWSTAIGHVGAIVLFGRLWRRAEVLTDAELVQLRYGGTPAKVLRSVQACFYAVGVNTIVLGWGLAAMQKVSAQVLPWPPEWVVVGLVLFALLYASLGGMRAVVLTDLAQFGFAMTGSVALAWLAVREVGGLGELVERVRAIPGGEDTLRLVPGAGSGSLVVTVFATYVLVQWWARMAADGGGYLAQRMFAARTDREAATAAGWFVWLHYVVRPWPWILVGLAALALFPPGSASELAHLPLLDDGEVDREAAYPLLLVQLMPVGLLGVAVAALLAAFMSTVDTHIHWGTSYLVNDLYGGLIRPKASRRELMIASWISMVGMALLALAVGRFIDRVEDAWKFLAAAGAGMGMPALLRWIWWRMTAWAELLGMLVGATAAVITYTAAPDLIHAHRLWITAGASVTASALAVVLGPATDVEVLRSFVRRVRPPGYWGPATGPGDGGLPILLGAWLAGVVAVFAALIGLGKLLLGPWEHGLVLGALALTAWGVSRALVRMHDRRTES